ncbi:MAG: hypothetical protein PW845_22550 [Pseudomonas sp.]|uniref:hypothetical protein n=1 Tax=Pseudomonas abieticivorans TaxID=2931382 RepID=UPI0020C148F0|nr:hypothetical protein [Pseudomonas sp. PIA16]MDE1168087.1 hypothetical protein [Pseudomonas sp.]
MTPLPTHPATPQLQFDANAPTEQLLGYANLRFRAVCNLLKCLSKQPVGTMNETELAHFATGAFLLLETGCEALRAVEQRLAA